MPFGIYRPDAVADTLHVRQIRATIQRSRDLLAKSPGPDTFIGRTTQETFPSSQDPMLTCGVEDNADGPNDADQAPG